MATSKEDARGLFILLWLLSFNARNNPRSKIRRTLLQKNDEKMRENIVLRNT